jgi:nuclear receptor subfamily 2 group E protein 1
LLEESWRDLFILTAIEQQFQINSNEFRALHDQYESYKTDLETFQEILNQFQRIKIDSNELICLKNFLLFKTYLTNSQLNDLPTINYLHNQSQILLNTYINKQYPYDENRFFKFLTLISSFHLITSSTIEEIFFRKTIGDQTRMEQLVKDMYQMSV